MGDQRSPSTRNSVGTAAAFDRCQARLQCRHQPFRLQRRRMQLEDEQADVAQRLLRGVVQFVQVPAVTSSLPIASAWAAALAYRVTL